MMGLFPTIGRAWLTIDAEIYVRQIYEYLLKEILLLYYHFIDLDV